MNSFYNVVSKINISLYQINKLNTMENLLKYNGRLVVQKMEFEPNETFGGYYAAAGWAKENGFSCGSMDGYNPIAMWYGNCSVSKWHNLDSLEQRTCDAVMIGEFREGTVKILIFNNP